MLLVACSRSVASNGKVLPFDPMPQILRCPGPSEGMSKEFVVFPDAVQDGVDPSLPAPPTASAEGPQQQLGLVEPRGPGRGIGVSQLPTQRLGLGHPMTGSMVHNQVDADIPPPPGPIPKQGRSKMGTFMGLQTLGPHLNPTNRWTVERPFWGGSEAGARWSGFVPSLPPATLTQ